MRNVTVKVDDQTYRDIRAWCAQRDTCVSHVVQAFLRDLPNREDDPCLTLPYTPNRPELGEGFEALQRAEIALARENLRTRGMGPLPPSRTATAQRHLNTSK